jgi:hypothetical protein
VIAKRPIIAALVLGLINVVIAVLALALVEVATPDAFGWYTSGSLDEVVVKDASVALRRRCRDGDAARRRAGPRAGGRNRVQVAWCLHGRWRRAFARSVNW